MSECKHQCHDKLCAPCRTEAKRDLLRAEVERLTKERDALKERVKDLEEAIISSHQTGCWGPIEDAYAAGGYPCLKHRAGE